MNLVFRSSYSVKTRPPVIEVRRIIGRIRREERIVGRSIIKSLRKRGVDIRVGAGDFFLFPNLSRAESIRPMAGCASSGVVGGRASTTRDRRVQTPPDGTPMRQENGRKRRIGNCDSAQSKSPARAQLKSTQLRKVSDLAGAFSGPLSAAAHESSYHP